MVIKANTIQSQVVKARVGQQNVSRVLSNATAPPVRLIDLSDVNSALRDQDGLILVWDLPTQSFIMTSVIDSSSTTIEGIAYFTNVEESTSTTTGAVVVSGGVGIGGSVNIGGGATIIDDVTLSSSLTLDGGVNDRLTVGIGASFQDIVVTGFSTFSSDVDINAFVSILNGAQIDGNTLLQRLTVSENATFNSTVDINATVNIDAADIDLLEVGVTTTTDLYVTGITSTKNINAVGFVSVTEGLYYDNEYDGPNGVAFFDNTGKLIGAASTESAIDTSNYILTTLETAGIGTPVWTSTIDGGEY